jgi:tripartite-type tricarboxylate transporter receptor subunit TctC
MRIFAWLAVSFATLFASPGMSFAQDYPTRVIKMVVPYPAGGGVDNLARPMGERLSQLLGQPVIIENKAGASTMIGGESVVRAAPDGYTLLFTTDSSITSNPFLFKKMPFDPLKDLTPVSQLVNLHQMVLLNPSVQAHTINELVALAKAKPNTLNYGSYGPGSQPNLLFEMLRYETGASIQQVSYRGIAPAITDTVSNVVQMTLGSLSVSAGLIETGRLRAIAVSRPTRLPSLPDVPTLSEAGHPKIDPQSWYGVFAPAGTPTDVVDKLQRTIRQIMNGPDFKQRYVESLGYTAVANTPAEFAAFIARDLDYKRDLIALTGITGE